MTQNLSVNAKSVWQGFTPFTLCCNCYISPMRADICFFVGKDPGTGISSLQSVAESSRSSAWHAAPYHWSISPCSFRLSCVLHTAGHNRGLVQLQVAPGSFSREHVMALTALEISGLISSCLQDAEKLNCPPSPAWLWERRLTWLFQRSL